MSIYSSGPRHPKYETRDSAYEALANAQITLMNMFPYAEYEHDKADIIKWSAKIEKIKNKIINND